MHSLHALALTAVLAAGSSAQNPDNDASGHWQWEGPAGWQRITLDLEADGDSLTGTITMGAGFLDGGPVPRAPGLAPPLPRLGPDPDSGILLSDVPLEDLWRYYVPSVTFGIENGRLDGDTLEFDQVVYMFEVARVFGAPLWCCFEPADTFHYTGVVDGDRLSLVRESFSPPDEVRFIGDHRFEFVATRSGATAASAPPEIEIPGAQRIDVAVFDEAGNTVTDLGPADFQIFEGGEERPLDGFAPPWAPRSLIVLIDRSLTWLKQGDLPPEVVSEWGQYQTDMYAALVDAVLGSFSRMQPADRVAVTIFEERIESVLPWQASNDGGQVDLTPLLAAPTGVKDLYGTLEWVLEDPGRPKGPLTVVVFTDGRDGRLAARWLRNRAGESVLDPMFGMPDTGEVHELGQLLEAVAGSGASINFVAVNTDRTPQFSYDMVSNLSNRQEGLDDIWPVPSGISELYPGATRVLDEYLGRIRSRMDVVSRVSGGRALFLSNAGQAVLTMSRLPELLGLGRAYTLEYGGGTDPSATVVVSTGDPTLRVVPLSERNSP